MKQLKKYVNDIFKDISMNEDLKLQKEELYHHLIDKVNDLMVTGMDEQDAISKVITDMGPVDEVKNEFNLVTENNPIIKKINKLSYFSFYSVVFSIIGLETFILSLYFFQNNLMGFVSLFITITIGILLLTYVLLQLDTDLDIKGQYAQIIAKIRRHSMVSIVVSVLSTSLTLPFISTDLSLINYLKFVIIYIIIGFFIIHRLLVVIDQKIFSKYLVLKEELFIKSTFLKDHIRRYAYVPFFIYLLLIVPYKNEPFFYVLLLISILFHMTYDFVKSRKSEKFNLYVLRLGFTFFILLSLSFEYIQFKFQLEAIKMIHLVQVILIALPSILLILFIIIRIIIYILNIKRIPNDNFIKRLGEILSTILYITCFILIYSTYVFHISDTIQFRLNVISANKIILFYLIMDLILKLIINQLLTNQIKVDASLHNVTESSVTKIKFKKLYILLTIVLLFTLLFIFKIPNYFIYKNNVQNNFKNQTVTNYSYQVYQAANHDQFVLSSYQLSDGQYCIGYTQFFSFIGPIRMPLSHHNECSSVKYTEDTIKSNFSVTMKKNEPLTPTHNIHLFVFGYNSKEYKELIIKFDWGQEIKVPINDEPLFFYYEDLVVPDDYSMEQFWSNDFYTEEKVKR